MGKVRRGGYVFQWWIGDHSPYHVHVFDSNGKLLGRVIVETQQPLDDWKLPRKVVAVLRQLQAEGRL